MSAESGVPSVAVSVMHSSACTVRTNSALPFSLRSNRCSPATVTMTDSGLLSPFASWMLRVQRPWAVYSWTWSSFGSAKTSTPWRPTRALNVPSESLSQSWKSRAIVMPASGMPFWFASIRQVPSIRPDVLRMTVVVRVRRGIFVLPGAVPVVVRRHVEVHQVGRTADLVGVMREDAETEGIKRAVRQVSGGLVDLPQGGDDRRDGLRAPVGAGCGAGR